MEGYFDYASKSLLCSVYKDRIDVLLHEFCHFKQFTEDKNLGKKLEIKGEFPFNIIMSYISKEGKYTYRDFRRACNKSYQLEVDCEIRAVKLIDELGLSINKEKYIKGAVHYIISYKYLPIINSWPNKKFRKDVITQLGLTKLNRRISASRSIVYNR